MKTIAFTNRKGGQGKTTMTVSVGAGLARRGYRVGLIDTDSQGNVAIMLGLQPENSLHACLTATVLDVEPHVRAVPTDRYSDAEVSGELLAIFGHDQTAEIAGKLTAEDIALFADMVEDFGELYELDYVLIDTAPSITTLDPHIYLSVDSFVIVSELEELAVNGINQSLRQIDNSNRLRKRFNMPENNVIGVLTNRARNTNLHRDNFKQLVARFGEANVWNPIPQRTKWGEASAMHVTIYQHADANSERVELERIVQRIEGQAVAYA